MGSTWNPPPHTQLHSCDWSPKPDLGETAGSKDPPELSPFPANTGAQAGIAGKLLAAQDWSGGYHSLVF